MTVVPAGAFTSASGPAAAIVVPVTSTTHPSCGVCEMASNTRAGFSSTLAGAAVGAGDCAVRQSRGNGESAARMESFHGSHHVSAVRSWSARASARLPGANLPVAGSLEIERARQEAVGELGQRRDARAVGIA